MKLTINVPVVTSLGAALLFALGASGCASSGHHAMINDDAPRLAENQGRGFARSSVVSPLGDAPGERDLELTREWPAERQAPVRSPVTGIARTGSVR